MKNFTISLQNRLALTYSLFIIFALILLTALVNIFISVVFTDLVKGNIEARSANIVKTISQQYNAENKSFNKEALEAIGIYFANEGYIVSVEDENKNAVWDARINNMHNCHMSMERISQRMSHFGMRGQTNRREYQAQFNNGAVCNIRVETFGPFFYSESESAFLNSINKLMIIASLIMTIFAVVISIILARSIAKPIGEAAEAAKQIAKVHSQNVGQDMPAIRINEKYKTKELSELASAINELAAELEDAKRRQKQLLSDTAHELRTPLACLQGDIEAMLDGVYKADKEHLENCLEEIKRLAGLVRDLNTLTYIEWNAGSLNKTEFDLASLLKNTACEFKNAAEEKGIVLKLNLIESPVKADYDRIKQVFINILSNAVQYTDSGSIGVTLTKSQNQESKYEITVSDTGIGISEEDLPHIFERFYRADKSRSRNTGGAGIGLAIAAAIVSAHNGTISAKSGKTGTIFTVNI